MAAQEPPALSEKLTPSKIISNWLDFELSVYAD